MVKGPTRIQVRGNSRRANRIDTSQRTCFRHLAGRSGFPANDTSASKLPLISNSELPAPCFSGLIRPNPGIKIKFPTHFRHPAGRSGRKREKARVSRFLTKNFASHEENISNRRESNWVRVNPTKSNKIKRWCHQPEIRNIKNPIIQKSIHPASTPRSSLFQAIPPGVPPNSP